MRRSPNSAVVIARLLGTEGFTNFVANGVEQYFRKRTGLTQRQRKHIARLDKGVADIGKRLGGGDKMVLGKFVGLHKKMSFDCGLRIGLMTFAYRMAQKIEAHERAGEIEKIFDECEAPILSRKDVKSVLTRAK